MVVEIPRWTNGKLEIKRSEPLSTSLSLLLLTMPRIPHVCTDPNTYVDPIFHDEKNDLPRFVESVWPHKSYPFIYGSVPQTWESPNFKHNFTNYEGDNDPVDIIDIGNEYVKSPLKDVPRSHTLTNPTLALAMSGRSSRSKFSAA